jgi:hypothetical protein
VDGGATNSEEFDFVLKEFLLHARFVMPETSTALAIGCISLVFRYRPGPGISFGIVRITTVKC